MVQSSAVILQVQLHDVKLRSGAPSLRQEYLDPCFLDYNKFRRTHWTNSDTISWEFSWCGQGIRILPARRCNCPYKAVIHWPSTQCFGRPNVWLIRPIWRHVIIAGTGGEFERTICTQRTTIKKSSAQHRRYVDKNFKHFSVYLVHWVSRIFEIWRTLPAHAVTRGK